MLKFIATAALSAATVAGAGYNYVSHQNVTIETQQRTITDLEQKFQGADASDKRKGALIDHVIQELRESRGGNG